MVLLFLVSPIIIDTLSREPSIFSITKVLSTVLAVQLFSTRNFSPKSMSGYKSSNNNEIAFGFDVSNSHGNFHPSSVGMTLPTRPNNRFGFGAMGLRITEARVSTNQTGASPSIENSQVTSVSYTTRNLKT